MDYQTTIAKVIQFTFSVSETTLHVCLVVVVLYGAVLSLSAKTSVWCLLVQNISVIVSKGGGDSSVVRAPDS